MFSISQRILLIELYSIKMHLDSNNSSNYKKAIEILTLGIESEYASLNQNLLVEGINTEVSEKVINTLDAFLIMEDSYSILDEESKFFIDKRKPLFKGFSALKEYEYFAYAEFIFKYDEKYSRLKKAYESHQYKTFLSCMPYYEKIKIKVDEFLMNSVDNLLTRKQLEELSNIPFH